MAELAVAYLSLVPTLKGAGKEIEKELGGISTDGAGKKVGAGFSAKIGSALKVGAVATGAAVAGVLATSLVKGFGRLNAIDQAQAKLTGLGHSGEAVEAVMENALNSVKGTAFGLDEAAGAAGILVGAGVQQGAELERALTLAADAATIAGTDMNSMGAIFGKVAAKGKLDGGVMAQLLENQIGILPDLAKHYGVTTEEASKMVSEGKVSFEDFADVMESTLGGAALASGDTFTGAMKNAGAALGRLGAQFLGPAFAQGSGIFMTLTGAIDKLGPVAAQAGEVVGGFLSNAMETVTGLFEGGNASFGRFGEVVMELAPKVMELFQNFSPLSLIFETIQPFLPKVAELFTQIGEALLRIIPPVLEAGKALVDALIPVIQDLISAIMPALIQVFDAVVPVLEVVSAAIMPVVNVLSNVLRPVIEALMPVVKTVFGVIADVISSAMTIIQGIIEVVTGLIEGDWSKVWDGIKNIFKGVWDAVVSILKGAGDILMSVLTATLDILNSLWRNAWEAIKTLFSNVWESIVSAATGFVDSVKDKFTAVMDFIGGIPDKVMGFFSGIGSWLVDSGKALIQGFIDGITQAFEWAKSKVSDGLAAIRDFFPFSPAKDGPFSGSGWVANSGKAVGATFTESVADSLHDGRKDIHDELGGIHDEFADASAAGQFSVRSAMPHAGLFADQGRSIFVQNPFTGEYLLAKVADVAGKRVDKKLGPLSGAGLNMMLGVTNGF